MNNNLNANINIGKINIKNINISYINNINTNIYIQI